VSILGRVETKAQPKQAAAERAARERFEGAMVELREGSYRFASRVRGQASIILEELIDPDGETVGTLADVEGDAGALALAIPIELITFETWLLGQIGDQDELDLDIASHRDLWFNFGAWIGQTLRHRHGGHWLIPGDDPKTWRFGFSKVLLEIAPFSFAEQLLKIGPGCAKRLVAEIERVRQRHDEQRERDGGVEIDRFTAQYYVRMHTMPLGQWMVVDLRTVHRLWGQAATRDLIKELRKQTKRLGEAQAPVIERVVQALEKADQDKPVAAQTADRGLFEAVAQIVGLRRVSAPVAMDILEKMVIPAVHVGIPENFPPLDDDDLANLRQGMDLFASFVDVVPHRYQADDEGFLGAIPHEDLSTPYGDRNKLQVGKGDWVVVSTKRLGEMLLSFDSARLLARFDEYVAYVRSNPKAPRRRDDGRYLAESATRALGELKACVTASSKDGHALVFRLLPPPG
jgi:hypothetical protein